MAIVEAAAAGLMVVSTAVGGVPEVSLGWVQNSTCVSTAVEGPSYNTVACSMAYVPPWLSV